MGCGLFCVLRAVDQRLRVRIRAAHSRCAQLPRTERNALNAVPERVNLGLVARCCNRASKLTQRENDTSRKQATIGTIGHRAESLLGDLGERTDLRCRTTAKGQDGVAMLAMLGLAETNEQPTKLARGVAARAPQTTVQRGLYGLSR